MASPIDERRTEVQRLAKRFDDQLRLARASELASMGRMLEAETLLCPGRHLPMSSKELDLLARIHVKQGYFDLARRRWEDASKISDRSAEFEECIEVLNDWLELKQRMLIWRIRLGLWIVTVLLSFWILHRLGLFTHMFTSS